MCWSSPSTDHITVGGFRLTRLGLEVRFVSAVASDGMCDDALAQYRYAWARPLRDVEMALTMSHRKAWQIVADSGQPHLILEDDAILTDSTPTVLRALEQELGLEMVNLETFMKPKLLGHAQRALGDGAHHLSSLLNDHGGAAAQVIWPSAAAQLLRATEDVLPPADAATNLAPGIARHQVCPPCAVQAMHVADMLGREVPGAGGIAPSFVSSTKRPDYPDRRTWLRCKLRRLGISMRLLGRKLAGLVRGRLRDPGPPDF